MTADRLLCQAVEHILMFQHRGQTTPAARVGKIVNSPRLIHCGAVLIQVQFTTPDSVLHLVPKPTVRFKAGALLMAASDACTSPVPASAAACYTPGWRQTSVGGIARGVALPPTVCQTG